MKRSFNKSPLIGVTPLWDAARQSVWMLPDYLDGIKAAGGIPLSCLWICRTRMQNGLWRPVTDSFLQAVRMSRRIFME